MKKYLLTPGPVEVPQTVLEAMKRPPISHRCAEFSELFKSVSRKLSRLFESERPVVILPSSGTGALECAAVNFLRAGDKFISLSCGVFGDRFREIALKTGASGAFVDAKAGFAPTPEDAAFAFAQNKDARAILITHNETSTGVAVPVKDIISALPKEHRPLIFVDGVSSVGTIECLPEAWGIDVLCAASQKGLLTPPGLGFVWLSKRAEDELSGRECPSYYFDMKRHLKHITQTSYANPYTPPVSLYFALDAALDVILKDGSGAWFARRKRYAAAFVAALGELGFEPFVKDAKLRSPGLTSMTYPGRDCEEIRKKLSAFGLETAGGMGDMKGKMIRAAHYSDWDFGDLEYILRGFAAAVDISGCESRISAAKNIYYGENL